LPVDLPKSSFNGTDVNLDLSHKSGFSLQIDAEGSLGIASPKDVLLNVTGKTIHMSGGGYKLIVNGQISTATIIVSPDGSIVITDGNGGMLAFDGLGNISLASPDGTEIDVTEGNIQVATADGTGVIIDETSQQVSVNAQNVVINGGAISLGANATHPVTVSDLLALIFNTHTHISAAPGQPTSPPVVPMIPEEVSSDTTIAE